MFDGLDPAELKKAKKREYHRLYRAAHPEREREKRIKYREANQEKVREADRERARKNRAANPEKAREEFRRWYAANQGEQQARCRSWYAENKQQALVSKARIRAKAGGLEFTITVDDLQWPAVCPVLGIELNYAGGKGRMQPDSPSIDRWDNTRGYTPGNVRVISLRANRLKNNADWRELKAVAAYAEYGLAPPGLEDIWGS